ncbi:hypothetical protein HJC23_002877 [Cyclotella cryptica]|uniref:Uncharacterized protein n=1 Tax=Cyclotella cryptica TaxID=29204 RepID=A0ABD3PJW1_9STRA
MKQLCDQQDYILSIDPSCLPRFDPHITLIGGVEISGCNIAHMKFIDEPEVIHDAEAAEVVLHRLRSAFWGFGEVTCEFVEEKGVFACINENNAVQWNQSCVAVVKKTDSFMKAMKVADETLFGSTSLPVERHFRPPISEPHYSFAYGNNVETTKRVKCPRSFTCSEIALWWTDPPELDAVASEWKLIGKISMN